MPVHPVKAPVITHEKLEETAKTTDNEELKKIIENAIGDSREEKKSKDEPVKPPVVNVDKNGQTTFFEKDNKTILLSFKNSYMEGISHGR